jgi:uncharacterized damage-inducible protein DinB
MALLEVAALRPAADEHNPYYGKYITLVPDGDIVSALSGQLAETLALVQGLDDVRAGHRYAPGKWSVREVIGHLMDTERVFAYRAMRFARGDATPLPSFDENAYVTVGSHNERAIGALARDFAAVRGATVALLSAMTPDEWSRRGTASNSAMSVRALAWTIAGHELHHRALLLERYGLQRP